MIEYPTEDDLIELNKRVLSEIKVKKADRYKLLSRGVIIGAIEAMKNDKGDLYDKASTLLIGLIKGHPFESGNRRTAFAATKAFLEINGEESSVVHNANVMQGIREGFYSKAEIKDWLKGHEIRRFFRK